MDRFGLVEGLVQLILVLVPFVNIRAKKTSSNIVCNVGISTINYTAKIILINCCSIIYQINIPETIISEVTKLSKKCIIIVF